MDLGIKKESLNQDLTTMSVLSSKSDVPRLEIPFKCSKAAIGRWKGGRGNGDVCTRAS